MPFDRNTMNTAEVQQLLSSYQTGTPVIQQNDIPNIAPASQQQTPHSLFSQAMQNLRSDDGRGIAESNLEEALRSGFGESRYDTDYYSGMDLEHARAVEQSDLAKIGAGLGKGVVVAGTTAANTTLGTLWGLGSALFELAADTNGNGRSFMDTMDAGVNNWFSNQMMKLQNAAEEIMPNYRTQEERSEQYQKQWWKHMGSANFIGDSFLKNFGFTVGAVAGGAAWTKAIGKLAQLSLANNILKGAAAAAEGDAAAMDGMKRAAEAIKRGTALTADQQKIVSNIKGAAASINKMKAQMQLYGSVIGALGEGTVEGLMAKNEYLEDYNNKLRQQYVREYNGLEQSIIDTGNKDLVTEQVYRTPDGQLVSAPILTEAGQRHLFDMQRQTTEKYQDLQQYAEEQGDRLASYTFMLNIPLLTASNFVQFGKLFSGGWKTNRNLLSSVSGGLKKGSTTGKYAAKGNKWADTILNSLKVAGTESFEELSQGALSSGAKQVADSRIAAFNNSGYDDKATRSFRDWLGNMYLGGADYLADAKNWQEGALGAITGLFGMPGRRWSGGIAEAYRDASEKEKASKAAADTLNNLVNSNEFQDRWHGYIRHLKYDNQMSQALEDDNQYAWHVAKDAQLASDVIAFADAGKLEDLNQIVSIYEKLSDEDVQGIREVMGSKDNEQQDWTRNLSDEEVRERVSKQAKEMKTAISEYKDLYDALSSRAPMDASPEFIKEMVFTAMNIKSFERRFMNMFGETMDAIEPVLLAMSSIDEEGNVRKAEESAEKFKNLRDHYERLFAGSLVPVNLPKPIQQKMDEALELLEQITEKEDPELNQKVKDMRKLSEDRKAFYKKLQMLREDGAQKKFDEDTVTTEKIETAAEEAHARQETEGLNSLNDVKQAYFSKDANGRADFLNTISPLEKSNAAIGEFMKLKRRFDGFRAFIEKSGITSTDPTVTPPMLQSAINDSLRRSRSEDELINLPDNVFSSFDEFVRDYSGIFGAPSASTHAAVKQAIRDAMQRYMANETATASRNSISPTPVTPQPAPGTVSVPTGYDAAQPASQEPAPNAGAVLSNPDKIKKYIGDKRTIRINDIQSHFGWNYKTAMDALDSLVADGTLIPDEKTTGIYIVAANQAEEQPEVGVAPKPTTPEQLANDAMDAAAPQNDISPVVEQEVASYQGEKKKIAHYELSVPEVASSNLRAARKAMRNRKHADFAAVDLSDFVVSHPEYAAIWNALAQRDAFTNTAVLLNRGDEIEFVIDPSFPDYKGTPQILLTVVKDNNERKILNVLSGQTSQFYGLANLRETIMNEYNKFKQAHPNDVFVFGKRSRVFFKRSGIIYYDYTGQGEKGITNIPGYSENAPIAYIDRDGQPKLVRGTNPDVIEHVSKDFTDEAKNSGKVNKDVDRRGNLYYLVRSDNDSYIPIRLNVEHFKMEIKNTDNPVFQKVRDVITEIAGIVKDTTNLNLEEQNQKLREQMKELTKYLDIHNLFFELGEYENVGVALRLSSPDYESKMRRPDQMSVEWLTDFIAGFDRPIQVRVNKDTGKIDNLAELIDAGIITSNARMMRPKGAEFYFNPWNGSEFTPVTEGVSKADYAVKVVGENENPLIAPEPMSDGEFSERNVFDVPEDIEPAYGEFPAEENESHLSPEQEKGVETGIRETLLGRDAGNPVVEMVHMKYSELPSKTQDAIKAKGYTEEAYNNLPDLLREKVLECLGV